jgi:hypothetical protein
MFTITPTPPAPAKQETPTPISPFSFIEKMFEGVIGKLEAEVTKFTQLYISLSDMAVVLKDVSVLVGALGETVKALNATITDEDKRTLLRALTASQMETAKLEGINKMLSNKLSEALRQRPGEKKPAKQPHNKPAQKPMPVAQVQVRVEAKQPPAPGSREAVAHCFGSRFSEGRDTCQKCAHNGACMEAFTAPKPLATVGEVIAAKAAEKAEVKTEVVLTAQA